MPLTAGARLGPYEIVSELGAGGMGEVYKARDTRLDRLVAIKILPPHLASDPQFRERFDREARTISQEWVAYNSDESGRNEVYVTPFPPSGECWRVSLAGGVQGRWRADSGELYFLAPDGTLMAASFAPGTPPEIGKPAVLFKTPIAPTYNLDHYAVAADGRFLLKVPPPMGEESLLNIVVNWTAALPKQ